MIRGWLTGGAADLQDAGERAERSLARPATTRAWERCPDRADLSAGALARPSGYRDRFDTPAPAAIIGAGRVVVRSTRAAPAADWPRRTPTRPLETAESRPDAPCVLAGRAPPPDRARKTAGRHGPTPADCDLPVHQRHQRHAQGSPAARPASRPRAAGAPSRTPADPGRPRRPRPSAVPRQRRGGGVVATRAWRGPAWYWTASSSRCGSLGDDQGTRDDRDERRSRDHHHLGHGVGRRPGGRMRRLVRLASAPLALLALRRFEQAFGVPVVETYGMTEAGQHDDRQPQETGRASRLGWPARAQRSGSFSGPLTGRSGMRGARPSPSAGCRSEAPRHPRSTRRAGAADANGPDAGPDTGDLGLLPLR